MAEQAQNRLFISHKKIRTATLIALALVFAIAILVVPGAQAQTFTLLHAFTGGNDGGQPIAGVIMDRAGNLYGTTTVGGDGFGTVFKLSRAGGGWILTMLYTFTGGADGRTPYGPLTFGPDGTLYGTTAAGGAHGDGTVFNVRPPSSICHSTECPWTETVLHSFSGADGADPQYGALIFDAAGNIYGTTAGGGTGCSDGACGVVFKMTKSGGNWTENVLYFFTNGSDGETPFGTMAFDNAGNLYGTTFQGSTHENGAIYELMNTGAAWTETTLHAFDGAGNDGGNPFGGVVFDQQGNLYGMTSAGGSRNAGTVYQLQPSGGNWTFNVIYPFDGVGKPFDTPTLDASGNLYGSTSEGGSEGTGNVFKLTNGSWTYTDLYDFNLSLEDGYAPAGSVVLDSSGNIYGTTFVGGNEERDCGDGGCGVVFEVTP